MRNKLLLPLLAAILVLSGCGYNGHYRYPCQDPANFSAPECNPPLCKVDGQCTIDILGFDPLTGEVLQEEMEQDGQE
jgi:hypothetical protein